MPVITIDGLIKRTSTAVKNQGTDEQAVVGNIVIEFYLNSDGLKALSDLLRVQNEIVRVQIASAQLELPRATYVGGTVRGA